MPRPIEPLLDDVFYTFYKAPKSAGSGIDWDNDEDDEEQKTRNKNWDDDLDEAVDDGFGGKKAPPFGSEERKNYSRSAGESTSDDFYGGDKPDDYYDDLNDGPEGEDKHPDPFVQRMRDQEKKSNLDNFGDNKAKPFGSEDDDVDDDVDEFLQGGDKE